MYFFGIEFLHGKNGVVLSRRKYALNLLTKTRLDGCKRVSTLVDTNLEL